MKIKHLTEKLTKKEQERYSLAFMDSAGMIVYVEKYILDNDTGTLIFIEEDKKISVENTIKMINRLGRRTLCVNIDFVNDVKSVIRVILSGMEENKITYEEIYDRLHAIEKHLNLK